MLEDTGAAELDVDVTVAEIPLAGIRLSLLLTGVDGGVCPVGAETMLLAAEISFSFNLAEYFPFFTSLNFIYSNTNMNIHRNTKRDLGQTQAL